MTLRQHQIAVVGMGLCLFVYSAFALFKPVHIDEANFLALASGDLWSPHDVLINWQGRTQRAFDVLSNPPGIAWLLHPFRDAPIWMLRSWMMLWSLLSLWGFWHLALSCLEKPAGFVLFLATSPVFALSHGAFLPDMPLLACTVWGWVFLLKNDRLWIGGVLIGAGFLFRYSALVPMGSAVFWIAWQRRPVIDTVKIAAAVSSIPLLLCLHDLQAYGSVHFWHMTSFQGVEKSLSQRVDQILAVFAQGASGVFLALLWRTWRSNRIAYTVAILGLIMVATDLSIWSALFVSMGVVSFFFVPQDKRAQWAGACLLASVLFLCLLRFTATRYWMPFLPFLVMYLSSILSHRYALVGFACSGGLSMLLCLDDWEFSRGTHRIAIEIAERNLTGSRGLAGHWGLQWHLEQHGFVPVEDDSPVTYDHVVHSASAWPQEGSSGRYELIERWIHPNAIWGPSVYAQPSKAHFHANMIAPDLNTYAAWGLYSEPFDVVTLWQKCSSCSGCVWDMQHRKPTCADDSRAE